MDNKNVECSLLHYVRNGQLSCNPLEHHDVRALANQCDFTRQWIIHGLKDSWKPHQEDRASQIDC